MNDAMTILATIAAAIVLAAAVLGFAYWMAKRGSAP